MHDGQNGPLNPFVVTPPPHNVSVTSLGLIHQADAIVAQRRRNPRIREFPPPSDSSVVDPADIVQVKRFGAYVSTGRIWA